MDKETRNHYLKLLGVFGVMFLIGTIYNQIFNNAASPTKVKEKKEEQDGGDCDYTVEITPAIIIKIDSAKIENCDMLLFRLGDFNDTVHYSFINSDILSLDSLEKKEIKTGDTVSFQLSIRTTGTCSPLMESIDLEKYDSKIQ